ncbi:hypothetical protein [Pseudoalteromonas aurantia]|uniref:hypothetical protein n=1 Tax=Pseudoalteromonas aurantia TaxID=43654 RepID=UPI00148727D5|nr:hypothetical protein [Pseudoalteromonas aurantia]
MINTTYDVSTLSSLEKSDEDEVRKKLKKKKDELACDCELRKIEAQYNLDYLFEDDAQI